MVLIGSVTAVAPVDPVESGEATLLHPSPWEAADAEAQFLADRILRREGGGLFLDDESQRALGREVKQALSLVRRAYPAMADVLVREEYMPGRIILGLEGELRDIVVDTWTDENASPHHPLGTRPSMPSTRSWVSGLQRRSAMAVSLSWMWTSAWT